MVADDEKKTSKCELFFTFIGLLRAIFRARSPGAEQLCIWICEVVFCVGFGTQEQKKQVDTSTWLVEMTRSAAVCVALFEAPIQQVQDQTQDSEALLTQFQRKLRAEVDAYHSRLYQEMDPATIRVRAQFQQENERLEQRLKQNEDKINQEKLELAKSMLTKKSLNELLGRCVHDIACLYLLETSKDPGKDRKGKKVYKYGCSANVKERMEAHATVYGSDCVFDTLIFIPASDIFKAETKFKEILDKSYFFKDDGKREELALSSAEHKTVRNAMKRVAEAYYATTMVHEHTVQMLEESHKVELEQKNVEIEKKNVELEKKNVELEKKNVEVEKKNAEIEKKHAKSVSAEKDITILQMKNNALDMKNSEQAQRIKELEDQLRRYSKNQVHPM
ncbi:hypothetical protein DVH05_017198 [Phytophthora capsici]|nr:hypothetical protein DVH05_017198 [Phytophthora capsici]